MCVHVGVREGGHVCVHVRGRPLIFRNSSCPSGATSAGWSSAAKAEARAHVRVTLAQMSVRMSDWLARVLLQS